MMNPNAPQPQTGAPEQPKKVWYVRDTVWHATEDDPQKTKTCNAFCGAQVTAREASDQPGKALLLHTECFDELNRRADQTDKPAAA